MSMNMTPGWFSNCNLYTSLIRFSNSRCPINMFVKDSHPLVFWIADLLAAVVFDLILNTLVPFPSLSSFVPSLSTIFHSHQVGPIQPDRGRSDDACSSSVSHWAPPSGGWYCSVMFCSILSGQVTLIQSCMNHVLWKWIEIASKRSESNNLVQVNCSRCWKLHQTERRTVDWNHHLMLLKPACLKSPFSVRSSFWSSATVFSFSSSRARASWKKLYMPRVHFT